MSDDNPAPRFIAIVLTVLILAFLIFILALIAYSLFKVVVG